MNASGDAGERFPLAAGLVTTAAGLTLLFGATFVPARLTGLTLAVLGAIISAKAMLRSRNRPETQSPAQDAAGPLRPHASPGSTKPAGAHPAQNEVAPPGADWLGFVISELIDSFNSRFDHRESGETLWPVFDRWVREALNEFLRARRVRCFHVADATGRLVSLTNELEEPLWPPAQLPGLIQHVLTTGRPYVWGGGANGESIDRLAAEWTQHMAQTTGLNRAAPDWLLPVREANRTIGLIIVGELPEPARGNHGNLAVIGGLMTTFWRYLRQADALAVAERTDQTSGLLTRADLTARAQLIAAESGRESEPVVVVALAVEGVRRLEDQGHWALRDRLMRRVGAVMRQKLRSDDLIGRFSEDRLVVVLRRLDLPLGQIIARKLLDGVEQAVHEHPVLEETVKIRCGLSDAVEDGFEPAIHRAFEALRLARIEGRNQPVAVPAATWQETPASGVQA